MPLFDLGELKVPAPEGYEARMLVIVGPEEKFQLKERPFQRNLVVAKELVPPGTSADEYCRAQLGQMAQTMPGFQRLKTTSVTISGRASPLVEARYTGPDGMLLTSLICYAVRGEAAYTISASHLTGPRFEAVRQELVGMIEQIELE